MRRRVYSGSVARGPTNRRLLAITPVDQPGGAEVHLLRLLAGLKSRGWALTVTTPGYGDLREAAIGAGYGWRALPLGGLGRGAGARAIGSWPTAGVLMSRTDVVYLNGSVCGRILPALRTLRGILRGPRSVLHVHDVVHRVPRFWRWADIVLADSQAVADPLTGSGLHPHVVYGPVDPDPPAVSAPWRSDGEAVIGFIGRIEPRKGALDLVRAVPAIRRGAPGARVVVIGDDRHASDPGYARAVTGSAEIEHHPWTANACGLMRHIDVLVLPSYQEPFGTVLAEAMAVGTPVVATDVDGLSEVVQDGVSGRLVAPGDPERLAEAVLEVLGRKHEMGAAARRGAQRFSAQDYVDTVERLIAS